MRKRDGRDATDPDTALALWAADDRQAKARQARSAAAWQKQLLGEEMRWTGVLLDLVECQAIMSLTTTKGRHHSGRLIEVGHDVAIVATDDTNILVALRAIAGLTTTEVGALASDRTLQSTRPTSPLTLIGRLGELQAERVRVAVEADGESTSHGRLLMVGADVIALELDGKTGTTFIPVSAINEVRVVG